MKILTSPFSILCFLFLNLTLLSAQVQMGDDLDGVAAFDRFGRTVSLSADGFRLAVGAMNNDGNGTNAGHIRIFEYSNGNWNQLGQDIEGDEENDNFGRSVSISADGSRVVTGAENGDGDSLNVAGYVRIFEWNGSDWIQLGQDINGEAIGDRSGYAVALSADGQRVAIGAIRNQESGWQAGQVRVFEYNGFDWFQLGTDIDPVIGSSFYGWSVALSEDGNRLAIGTHLNDENGTNAGQVQVFDWNETNWTQVGSNINGSAALDYSGWSIDLSSDGNRLAIGALQNDGNGENSGQVRVFEYYGNDWMQTGEAIYGEAAGDRFGQSVALSFDGHRLAVGASYHDGNGPDAGQARLFEWTANGWMQLGLDIDGEAEGDKFGFGIAISEDGKKVAVGALDNAGNGEQAGHVRVFENAISTALLTEPLIAEDEIIIYPNPGSGVFKINSEILENLDFEIVNRFGGVVLSGTLRNPSFDLSGLPEGMYTIIFKVENQLISKRILKLQ